MIATRNPKHPLAKWRLKHNYNYKQAAAVLGICGQMVWDIENDRVALTPKTIEKLAKHGIVNNGEIRLYVSARLDKDDKRLDELAKQHNTQHPIRFGGWIMYPDKMVKDETHRRWMI